MFVRLRHGCRRAGVVVAECVATRCVFCSRTPWVAGLDAGSRNVSYSTADPLSTVTYMSTAAVPSPTAWAITTIVMGASTMSVYFNGTLQQSRTGSLVQPDGMAIGGYFGLKNAASQASTVDIGELIIYRRELTSAEIGNVVEYLSYKWGLSTAVTTYPVDTTAITTDAYNTMLVQQQFTQMSSLGTAYVRQPFNVTLDSSMMLTLSAQVLLVRVTLWGSVFGWPLLGDGGGTWRRGREAPRRRRPWHRDAWCSQSCTGRA